MSDTTKPAPRAAFLAETGSQFITQACSPANSNSNDNSGIEETYWHIIHERVFLGHDNATALVSYQSRGSEAATLAGVSRQYPKYVGRWFAHYNLVAPWDVRTNAEKKRLKEAALGSNNFPVIQPPTSGTSSTLAAIMAQSAASLAPSSAAQPPIPRPVQLKKASKVEAPANAEVNTASSVPTLMRLDASSEDASEDGHLPQSRYQATVTEGYEEASQEFEDDSEDEEQREEYKG